MNQTTPIIDHDEIRNKALIANLWVILATIITSATLTLSVASSGHIELFSGFLVYFLSNSLALWAAYRKKHRLALIGYTTQVFLVTTLVMILLNDRPAHMVLAMTNFVLLHAVVLGRRAALIVTSVMVGLLLIATVVGKALLPVITVLVDAGTLELHISDTTELISLMTTTFSTGYLIITTISLQDQSRSTIVEAHHQLANAKSDLQSRLDKDRYLSKLGAKVASATSIEGLHAAILETLHTGLSGHGFAFVPVSDNVKYGIPFGNGPTTLLLLATPRLSEDDERFVLSAANLFERAHTRMVTDERFRAAERLEGVGRLAASVAHDFNNLLMPISATYELIEHDDHLHPHVKELIGPAIAATRQASALVKKLLVHACSLELNVEPIDLSAVIQSSEPLLRTFIYGDTELIIHLPTEPAPVLADKIELEQVLLNLVLNAINAINSSGTIVIALHQTPSTVILEVRDNGPGVPSAIREWVLEPFHTTHPEGSGLGLSTVQRIVHSGAGTVEIETAPEGGACIKISLPAVSAELITTPSKYNAPQHIDSLRILLVEDDPRVSKTLQQMLEGLGHKCVHVSDGGQALQKLDEHTDFDLVLTDYQMPVLNGAELVHRLRERHDYRPVILITGYGAAMTEHVGPKPNAILGKPLRIHELQDALSKVMQETMDTDT